MDTPTTLPVCHQHIHADRTGKPLVACSRDTHLKFLLGVGLKYKICVSKNHVSDAHVCHASYNYLMHSVRYFYIIIHTFIR